MSDTTASPKSPNKLRKLHQTHAAPPAPIDLPLRERVAARLKGLAAEAHCADLAEGAGDPGIAGDTVRQLMAHQLAAGHALAMGLAARAGRLVRECEAESGGAEESGRRSLELLRFSGGTARLMERCRAAALALDRIGYPEPPEGPDDNGPQRCDHPHHYAWRLSNERKGERRRVLDWLAQGKKASELPDVDGWPPYQNPDPDIEKLDERLAQATDQAAPRPAAADLRRGRLRNGNPSGDYLTAPRCGAATRAGACCRQPAMPNGRCRFHGGKSTGPRTANGLRRAQTARLVHGFRTAEIIDLRRAAARTGRNLRALTSTVQRRIAANSQRIRSDSKNFPLPLGERGRGEGFPRASAPRVFAQLDLDANTPTFRSQLVALARAIGPMPRCRALDPSPPAPSPPRGEGSHSPFANQSADAP